MDEFSVVTVKELFESEIDGLRDILKMKKTKIKLKCIILL